MAALLVERLCHGINDVKQRVTVVHARPKQNRASNGTRLGEVTNRLSNALSDSLEQGNPQLRAGGKIATGTAEEKSIAAGRGYVSR